MCNAPIFALHVMVIQCITITKMHVIHELQMNYIALLLTIVQTKKDMKQNPNLTTNLICPIGDQYETKK